MTLKLVLFLSLFFTLDLSASKVLFSSFSNVPKRVYEGQVFAIKINILSTLDTNVSKIKLEFKNTKNVNIIDYNSNNWSLNNVTHKYSNIIHVQIKNTKFKFPNLKIYFFNNKDKIFAADSLSRLGITVISILKQNGYSGVIAKNLKIKKYTSDKYNDKFNIIAFKINATQSNLQDFTLDFKKQKIDSSNITTDISSIYFHALVPTSLKVLRFSYFNLTSNRLEYMKIPIKILNYNVSTQIDLNPKESIFKKYKIMFFASFIIIFLLLYIFFRKIIFIIFFFICIVFLLSEVLPLGSVIVKAGTQLKILPTKNSTIIYEFKEIQEVEKLAIKRNYVKVLLNNKIGWIRDEDISKN